MPVDWFDVGSMLVWCVDWFNSGKVGVHAKFSDALVTPWLNSSCQSNWFDMSIGLTLAKLAFT